MFVICQPFAVLKRAWEKQLCFHRPDDIVLTSLKSQLHPSSFGVNPVVAFFKWLILTALKVEHLMLLTERKVQLSRLLLRRRTTGVAAENRY